jgi:acetyl-CoA carboxylase biotin carboxyl carrier protein
MSDAGAGDVFDLDRLRELIELMEQHDLGEIDLQQQEMRIRLQRGSTAPVPAPLPAAPQPAAAAAAESEEPSHIVYIKSPMVGTFYSRPNPEATPFIKVGDHVDSETTVCIVEAMKTFNEIPAEVSGEVVAVLVDDGEPVEFDKPLFKIDTSR